MHSLVCKADRRRLPITCLLQVDVGKTLNEKEWIGMCRREVRCALEGGAEPGGTQQLGADLLCARKTSSPVLCSTHHRPPIPLALAPPRCLTTCTPTWATPLLLRL